MHKLHYIPILIAMLVSTKNIKAQIPITDPAWHLEPDGTSGGTEEFNSAIDYTYKWWELNDMPGWGAEYLYNTNLDQSTGTTLKIKADVLSPGVLVAPCEKWALVPDTGVTYVFQSAAIQSRELYSFGYFEISAIYPTSYYSYWPAFWLWNMNCNRPEYEQQINEIDIAENSATISNEGHTIETNIHMRDIGLNCADYGVTGTPQEINNLPLLSTTWHKYAMEWAPDRITWYFDDVPVRTFYDALGTSIPQYTMALVLNFAVDPMHTALPSDWNIFAHSNDTPTSYPKYFEIDYVHYYKLATECSTPQIICTPSDYNRSVKSTISTDVTCTPTFNPSTIAGSYTLLATDYILLNAGTEINPTGTGYISIVTMPCPE